LRHFVQPQLRWSPSLIFGLETRPQLRTGLFSDRPGRGGRRSSKYDAVSWHASALPFRADSLFSRQQHTWNRGGAYALAVSGVSDALHQVQQFEFLGFNKLGRGGAPSSPKSSRPITAKLPRNRQNMGHRPTSLRITAAPLYKSASDYFLRRDPT